MVKFSTFSRAHLDRLLQVYNRKHSVFHAVSEIKILDKNAEKYGFIQEVGSNPHYKTIQKNFDFGKDF